MTETVILDVNQSLKLITRSFSIDKDLWDKYIVWRKKNDKSNRQKFILSWVISDMIEKLIKEDIQNGTD